MRNKLSKRKIYQVNKLINLKEALHKCLISIVVLIAILIASSETLVTDFNLSPSFANAQENLVFGDGGKKQDLENLSKTDIPNRPRTWSKRSVQNGHRRRYRY